MRWTWAASSYRWAMTPVWCRCRVRIWAPFSGAQVPALERALEAQGEEDSAGRANLLANLSRVLAHFHSLTHSFSVSFYLFIQGNV